GEELVCQSPRLQDKKCNCGEKFRVPIQEGLEYIPNDMPEGATVIDRGLPALDAVMAGERCAAVLAVRERSMPIFASTEPAPSGGSLDRRNRRVTEDNLCRFIGHTIARLQKDFLCVDCA